MAVIISGAGAPAKTKKWYSPEGEYIFSGKGPTFSASCKTSEHYEFHACMRMRSVNAKHTEHKMRGAKPISKTFSRKDERTMGQIKRNWFVTIILRNGGGFDYGRWKEKIQI